MPALTNPKHELFAQALAEGLSADAAYQRAGYRANRGNATTLKANQSVRQRLTELQSRSAERTEVTIAGLTKRLLAIAAKGEQAAEAPLLAVARAAIMDAAKLNGLVVEKVEAKNENRTVSDRPLTEDQWEAQHVHSLQ